MAIRHTQEPFEVIIAPSGSSVSVRATQVVVEVIFANVLVIETSGTLLFSGALTTVLPRTRLYFSSTLPANVSPAFGGGWGPTSQATRWRLNHVKGTSAIVAGSQIAWPSSTANHALDRQYVSNPLEGAQVVGGLLKAQLLVREFNVSDNVDALKFGVFVVSQDGLTLRGTVIEPDEFNISEFLHNNYRNKTPFTISGTAGTPVNALDGDRIVVEIGYRSTGGSGAPVSPEASGKYGENATDLAQNETDTTDGAGWFELAGTLAFVAVGSNEIVVGGTLTPTGNLLKTPGKPFAGTLTPSGVLTRGLLSIRSFAGTLTTAGTALILEVSLVTLSGAVTFAGTVTTKIGHGVLAAGTLTSSGALIRLANKATQLGGTLLTTGFLRNRPGRALEGTLSASGNLTPSKVRHVTMSGALSLTGALVRSANKLLSGILSLTGAMGRGFGRLFSGSLTPSGRLMIAESTGTVVVCETIAGDLVTRVYERLDDNQVYYTEAEVLHALDMAQRLFCWLTLCLERIGTFVLTIGTTFYTGSNGVRTQLLDFWVPLRFSLSSNGSRISPDTLDNLDKLDSGWQSFSGTPRKYVQMGYDFFAIYPQPTAPLGAHFVYAAEPEQITALASPLNIPADQAPLLVDYALWLLRAKEGGQEFAGTLDGLGRFVAGAKKYAEFVRARSKAQLYDHTPPDLSLFDLSRFVFKPPRETRETKK